MCTTCMVFAFRGSMVAACAAAGSQDAPPPPGNDGDGLKSLIDVFRKEEITVHVDIASKMRVRSCARRVLHDSAVHACWTCRTSQWLT